ncbi:MAG: hypothetical protein M1335_01025 [Chloroflexi bacterium]|nr:hypothetical protein [Chloroflexota bacterium]
MEKYKSAAWIGGIGMCVAALWLVIVMTPFVAPRQSTRELMNSIPPVPEAMVATFGLNKTGWLTSVPGLLSKPSLLFYAKRSLVDAGDVSRARALLSKSEPVFVICRQDIKKLIMVPATVEWATSGDLAIVANSSAAALKGTRIK